MRGFLPAVFRIPPIVAVALLATGTWAAGPADLAEDLAALVAEGKGILMPDLAVPHVENRGVMELGGDFPAPFLSGLVPAEEHGVTVYPVSIRIDDATGNAIFFNAAETPFYTVPRVAPANWFALLHPLLATNPWFDESRVVAQWTLVPPESLDAYLAAINAPPPPLRSVPAPAELEITNLMFTAISVSESNVVLDVAWPTNSGIVTLRTPWLYWGTLSEIATVHWCASNGPAFSTDSNLTTQYLEPNAATTNSPFALPNLVDEFLIDASRTSSMATLTYSLDVGEASPAIADSLSIRIVDIDLPDRAVRPSELASVEYDLSSAVSNVTGAISWTIEPMLENGARLLPSSSSANGTVSLSGGTNVWISPGSVVRDYLVTATCSTETNLSASATVYVGRVNIDGDFYRNGGFADHAEKKPWTPPDGFVPAS